jgi:mono/diheme cytochrome c family protein
LVPGEAEAVPDEPVSVEGDASEGAKLALAHCGRCHVVDARNPFGGIGSTPSFGAMRSAPDWLERFSAFWAFNPHPAFTQVADITEPFSDQRPPPIAPLELTLDEVMAITAFVATLPPKDLGARVQAR